MQVAPRAQYSYQPIRDLHEAIWRSYLHCLDSFQVFEMESQSNSYQGSMHATSSTQPSMDRFAGNVLILQGVLEGADWLDDEYRKSVGPTEEYETEILISEGPYRDPVSRKATRTRKRQVDEFTIWTEVNKLLKRKQFWKVKPVLGEV